MGSVAALKMLKALRSLSQPTFLDSGYSVFVFQLNSSWGSGYKAVTIDCMVGKKCSP